MIERYFAELDPPEGGLQHLRRRLEKAAEKRKPGGWRLVPLTLAAAVAAMIAIGTSLRSASQEHRLHAELERVFVAARTPAVSIDDQVLVAHRSKDGALEVYLGTERPRSP
jgi:hypothetical protein